MNAGFESEAVARERAKKDMPSKRVTIIESRGQFYVEPSDEASMIRSWEREVYTGPGKGAVPRKGYSSCRRCGQFVNYDKGFECQRCGQDVGVSAVGTGGL